MARIYSKRSTWRCFPQLQINRRRWFWFSSIIRHDGLFSATAKFLVRISQYIKMIQLNGIETSTISVLPIIKGMLSGKCERLYFVGRTKPLEGEEVEQLIRVNIFTREKYICRSQTLVHLILFHDVLKMVIFQFTAHQNKKLFLCVTFKLSEFSTQIGMDKIFARYNQLYMNV